MYFSPFCGSCPLLQLPLTQGSGSEPAECLVASSPCPSSAESSVLVDCQCDRSLLKEPAGETGAGCADDVDNVDDVAVDIADRIDSRHTAGSTSPAETTRAKAARGQKAGKGVTL